MERMQVTCSNCHGWGSTQSCHVVDENPDTHICNMEFKYTKCEQCGGSGYIEYAVFSIEEAEAILKHCGLEVK